jgi:hypothetical protein
VFNVRDMEVNVQNDMLNGDLILKMMDYNLNSMATSESSRNEISAIVQKQVQPIELNTKSLEEMFVIMKQLEVNLKIEVPKYRKPKVAVNSGSTNNKTGKAKAPLTTQ